MILVCYDGSPDAKAAIAEAGKVLAGHPAIVLSIWEPVSELMARTPAGYGLMAGLSDPTGVDEATRGEAERVAEEGAELARRAGLDASARARPADGTIADSILQQADNANATAIVMGTRGRTGLRSLLLGSVSHAVVQRADRAVLVAPSAAVAGVRRRRLHPEGEAAE